MSTISSLFINVILLLSPISIYLLYCFCIKTINLKDKDFFFDLTLFSMLYMLLRYGEKLNTLYPSMLYNLPLFICYLKQKKNHAILISIILGTYSYINFGFHPILLFLEYGMYAIVYKMSVKKNIDIKKFIYPYILIRIFFITMETVLYIMQEEPFINTIVYIFLSSFILIAINYIILFLFQKAEEISNYKNTLEELSREKDLRSALFKITHEVKNPLAVCKGYLDMLENASLEKYEKYVPIIDSEIKRTLLLMDDFLDYTKVKINKEEADIIMLLEEVCLELDPLFIKNKVIKKFNLPDDEIYVDIDYNRMKQVFVNVLKNSMEASKGKLKIGIDIIKEQDKVIIKISDNGQGIPKEILDRIGETFFTTKERGTGLGVSLSMEIVELHGGKMYYESVEGKKTDVFIEIPYKEEYEIEKVAYSD